MSVLEARNLAVRYDTPHGATQALDGATLSVATGEAVALVGESGSGKTTLGLAAMGLLPATAVRTRGELLVDGRDVFGMSRRELRELRRTRLGLVLQDAAGSLDPTRRIASQIGEALPGAPPSAILAALERVRLPDVERVARAYPHELSGGMAQRAAIAIALACSPSLIVADEPTAALDTEVKGEILRLLADLAREAHASLLILTHDILGVASGCTRLAVMYGGRVVEQGAPTALLERPRHPYTRGLLGAVPGSERVGASLRAIPGAPPVLAAPSVGCAFAGRCEFCAPRCLVERPDPGAGDPHATLCHRATEVAAIPFGTTQTGAIA